MASPHRLVPLVPTVVLHRLALLHQQVVVAMAGHQEVTEVATEIEIGVIDMVCFTIWWSSKLFFVLSYISVL